MYTELDKLVAQKYSEFYPHGVKKMTQAFMGEIYDLLSEIKADYGEFCEALKTYRYEEDSNYAPSGPQLKPHILKQRKKTTLSISEGGSDAVLIDFFHDVTNLGWSTACQEWSWDEVKAEWLSKVSILDEYSCFTPPMQEYLKLHHSGDIVAALKYYIDHAPQKDKVAIKKQLWTFENMSYDNRKKFYPVFRDKTLKGNWKNKFIMRPNYSGIAVQRRTA